MASFQNDQSATLANGVRMPFVSMGCAFGNWTGGSGYQGFLPEQASRATHLALSAGLRSFDMARCYGTERHVGDILAREFAAGNLSRDDVFLTTKVFHPTAPPHISISHRRTWNPRDLTTSIRQRVLDDVDISLENIGVGQLDLLLLHWPGAFNETDAEYAKQVRIEIWQTMEDLYSKGIVRAIGVCNFSRRHLEELFTFCKVRPMVNQFELHPYCQPQDLITCCRENNIVIQAYCPYASGAFGLLKDPVLEAIAQRHSRSVGQIILRWQVQQGHMVIPKSSSQARMVENISLFDFTLTEEDIQEINALGGETKRTCPDPEAIL